MSEVVMVKKATPSFTPAPAFRLVMRLLVAALAVSSLGIASPACAAKWPSFSDDLKVARPQVDPESDAEALLWEIRILDEISGPSHHSDVSHYLRIKVFTERGKELAASVDIPHDAKTNVVDLAARTIRPDGTTIEVPRSAFYKRMIVKSSGRKVRAVSFAFPSVERGCIVEYRWTERRYEEWIHGLTLDLQCRFPVRTTELWLRPVIEEGVEFGMRWFNFPAPHFEEAPGGFRKAVLASTPGPREEPCMPPELLAKPWAVFFYKTKLMPPPDRFWPEFARQQADEMGSRWRPDPSIARRATELTSGASSEDDKLVRLSNYCRTRIRNIDEDAVSQNANEATDDERSSKQSPGETLKREAGSGADIDYLFAAMARSLGFEVRIARTVDRRTFIFDPEFQFVGLLGEWCVAVRVGDQWRYFSPAERYIPPGMVPWYWEGQQAILLDAKKEQFVTFPVAPPDSNRVLANGHFRLSADGTLEGTASETFSGQWSRDLKEKFDGMSLEKRVDDLKGALRERFPGAVLDSVRIEHADDAEGSFERSYHIRVPSYATRAGSRLLVPPGFFQVGVKPLFQQAERRYAIWFDYPAYRRDEVRIELPDSFQVEAAPDAKPFAVPGFLRHDSTVRVALDGRSILFSRSITTCENGEIAFRVSNYPAIKTAFEQIHERDGVAISLRKGAVASAP